LTRAAALLALACLAACGGAAASLAIEETVDLLPGGGGEPPGAAAPAPARPGTVSRSDLDELLAAGPAALLARVETAPEREGGRFAGFRITGFPGGPPAAVDLRVGDVVVRVNGRGIERPEQYFEVFRALAGAAEIRFEIIRDGAPLTLTCPVVD